MYEYEPSILYKIYLISKTIGMHYVGRIRRSNKVVSGFVQCVRNVCLFYFFANGVNNYQLLCFEIDFFLLLLYRVLSN